MDNLVFNCFSPIYWLASALLIQLVKPPLFWSSYCSDKPINLNHNNMIVQKTLRVLPYKACF